MGAAVLTLRRPLPSPAYVSLIIAIIKICDGAGQKAEMAAAIDGHQACRMADNITLGDCWCTMQAPVHSLFFFLSLSLSTLISYICFFPYTNHHHHHHSSLSFTIVSPLTCRPLSTKHSLHP